MVIIGPPWDKQVKDIQMDPGSGDGWIREWWPLTRVRGEWNSVSKKWKKCQKNVYNWDIIAYGI